MKNVSVIIPAYNVEKYIEKCIESVLNQTYKNFEIIIVNDGSTDRTLDVIQKYKFKDDRIKVIDQENRGVSHARNAALRVAEGTYISFIDSDDYICEKYLEELVRCFENNVELAVCGYTCVYKNDSFEQEYNKTGILLKEDIAREILDQTKIKGFLWNKLFLKNIIVDNNIMFDTNISMCEDLLFCMQYVKYIKKCFVKDISLYRYRQRKSSAIGKVKIKDLSCFDAIEKINKIDTTNINYSYDLFVYLYFKYYKNIKTRFKVNIFSVIFDERVSKKTKVISIFNRFVPEFIGDYIREKKQDKYEYYE